MSDLLYEMKPLLCIVSGIITLIAGDNLLAAIAGLLLFASGSWIWILRSHARRKDRKRRKTISKSAINWYEIKPFACIAFGLLAPYINDHSLVFIVVLLFIWSGTHIIALRIFNRRYAF